MAIDRIEAVTYGVADLDEGVRFFTDFGLSLAESDASHARFVTLAGQSVVLKHLDDPSLPPPVEEGPGIREVIWGVTDADDLARIGAELRKDREVTESDGVVRSHDETGWGIGFAVAQPTAIEHPLRRYNRTGRVERVNEAHTTVGQVTPFRICHVALNIEKRGREEAVAFYTDRLGFKATDIVKPMGVFMRAPGDSDQHTFLLCHRPDRVSTNHTSYEVAGFDDVIEGVNHMLERGWRESRRLGRHTIGSNVFRFVQAPVGGRVELAADMDRVDDSYGPNVYEEAQPHHIYTLRTNRDDEEGQGE